jgi:hypothetical protein
VRIRICIRTHKHTSIQAYKHTSIQAYKHTHTCTQTYKHTCTQAYKLTSIPAYMYAYPDTRIHTYEINTYKHTDVKVCIHAFCHRSNHHRTRTRAQSQSIVRKRPSTRLCAQARNEAGHATRMRLCDAYACMCVYANAPFLCMCAYL